MVPRSRSLVGASVLFTTAREIGPEAGIDKKTYLLIAPVHVSTIGPETGIVKKNHLFIAAPVHVSTILTSILYTTARKIGSET